MSVVTAIIKSEGKEMNGQFELLSIDVAHEFNKIPTAELKFIDGDIAKKEFKILDDTSFAIGKKIDIALKYEDKPNEEVKVFRGIVTNKLLELNRKEPTLTIELSDVFIQMNSHRKSTVYHQKKDHEIITSILEPYGFSSKKVEDTTVSHQQMIQHYATDWDFMLSRAEANAQLVSVVLGEISIFQPELKDTKHSLEVGSHEIYDFDLQINGNHQYKNIVAVGWDLSTQKSTKSTKSKNFNLSSKGQDIDSISKALGTKEMILAHGIPTISNELETWSNAQQLKTSLSYIKGWIKIPGTGKIKVGDTLEIKEFSKTLSGNNIVSGVRHEVTTMGWCTYIQIGMDACWFIDANKVIDTPAAGLLPGVNGLQVGIIQPPAKDPDNLNRIKVMIPAFGEKQNTVWARLTTLDAGVDRGTFFLPQSEDEVIVGFLNDDPRHAIIMGSVYSPKNKPPISFDTHPKSKGIFTKSKYQLFFDEEKECITIATSEKNKITIDEKQQRIELADSQGNQIELSKKGINILSANDCKIQSKGNLKIEAVGAIEIKGNTVDVI
ncbi:type VI secretion system tip protein VgrG [Aquimarina macrocephali]|uniref:type VI secretion system tip protein VgrG n=1 Tax=Aquimarina macrocephali TaxID=666563 RepID=UPI00046562AB|nr:type VI secretion system tip protein VgrG [Aquimarina macrocephali]